LFTNYQETEEGGRGEEMKVFVRGNEHIKKTQNPWLSAINAKNDKYVISLGEEYMSSSAFRVSTLSRVELPPGRTLA